jgi:hypothetical protein
MQTQRTAGTTPTMQSSQASLGTVGKGSVGGKAMEVPRSIAQYMTKHQKQRSIEKLREAKSPALLIGNNS